MSQFSQRPVRSKGKSHSALFASFEQIVKDKDRRPKTQPAYNRREKPRGSGFSFPVPSVATLAVIAGTVLLALTALKWEDIRIKIPESYAFQPAAEEDSGRRTLSYAATDISGFASALQLPEIAQPAEKEQKKETEVTEKQAETAVSKKSDLITFEWQQHKVQRGEAVSTIAKRFGVSTGAIIASNNIVNARRLQEGAVLRIPNIDGIPYTVKKGDSLIKIAASFNVPLEVILDINDIKSDLIREGETIFIPGARMNDLDLKKSLGELFIYPVQSRYVTSKFGMRKDPISGELNFHTGIDLRGNIGAAVTASLDGTVSVVSENWLYGKYIIISHGNGYKTLYAHLSSYSVKQGDRVSQGKKIAEVGNTGYSTGSHLHFGIYDKNGKLVNPLELLN